MAKKKSTTTSFDPQNSSGGETRRFDEGLERSINDYHLKDTKWTYARNAINNSKTGDLGKIGNEPANKLCITVPAGYTIIGAIHVESDKYVIYSTNNVDSEIGYFQEDTCEYDTIVNDRCLNFSTDSLIYGVSRETSECNHVVYWDDGINPSRVLNIGDIRIAPYRAPDYAYWPTVPWVCQDTLVTNTNNCYVCIPVTPLQLDCDKIRLAPLMNPLCFRVEKSAAGGNLLNGSYFVVGAYTIKGERVTDYFPPSNQQPLFDHIGVGGSITIYITNADTDYFDEFELVVVSVIAQQTVAKRVGIYSTKQKEITLDIIDTSLQSVPIEYIPVRSQIYDKSDAMYTVNDYLLRVGPTTKFDFNYQPLANQIVTKWQSVEYPAEYYKNGGNKTGYMRDEVYSFFIRWVYNTGDRSASYHIPGRPAFINAVPYTHASSPTAVETSNCILNDDAIEIYAYNCDVNEVPLWQQYNTAQITASGISSPIDTNFDPECNIFDQGFLIAEGYMGYWESSEFYPDDKPQIWNANITSSPYPGTNPNEYNLCGRPIRHHRFPDNDKGFDLTIFNTISSFQSDIQKIRIMGVKFENIRRPLNDPFDPTKGFVPGVIGFEILRGSRKGNRSVIAKGIINNMVEYDLPVLNGTAYTFSNIKGLFQNYPYNDLNDDPFLQRRITRWQGLQCDFSYYDNKGEPTNEGENTYIFGSSHYKRDYFSFHSPETNFSNPFLGSRELKVYQDLDGIANMRYQIPNGHPNHKLMTDLAWLLSAIVGLGLGTYAATGRISRSYNGLTSASLWETFGLNAAFGAVGLGIDTANSLFLTPPLVGPGTTFPFQGVVSGAETTNEGLNSLSPIFSVLFGLLGGVPTFTYFWSQGAETVYELLTNLVDYRQYALQLVSHCLYDNLASASRGGVWDGLNPRALGQRRRYLDDLSYVDNQIQNFDSTKRINNLYRSRFVAMKTSRVLSPPTINDVSRTQTHLRGIADTLGTTWAKGKIYKNPETVSFVKNSSTYYVALKQRLRNQYGQIDGITQLPVTNCPFIFSDPNGNCIYVPVQEMVVNGFYVNTLNPWVSTPNGYWIRNGSDQAQTTSPVVNPNDLRQNIPFITGNLYTLSFRLIQLDPNKQLNVGFQSGAVVPNDYIFTATGSYVRTFTAGSFYDALRFSEQIANPSLICPVDVMINIDCSGSVNPNEWLQQRQFAQAIVTALAPYITADYVRIGYLSYSENIFVNGPLGYYLGNPQSQWASIVQNDIFNNIFYEGTSTGNGDALNAAWNQLTTSPNARPTAQKYIIHMGDGTTSNGGAYGPTAASAIFAAGGNIITAFIYEPPPDAGVAAEYQAMQNAGYYEGSFANLQPLVSPIVADLCNDIPTIIDNVSIKRLACIQDDPNGTFATGPLFNGDIYINRYTEKNTFFYFFDWLYNQPDGAQLDYTKYYMLPYATYWVNTEGFDVGEGILSIRQLMDPVFLAANTVAGTATLITGLAGWGFASLIQWISGGNAPPFPNISTFPGINQFVDLFREMKSPSDYHVLDRPNFAWPYFNTGVNAIFSSGGCSIGWIVKYGYFYLFNSGVRDFYVESEYNVALRDWDDEPQKRHYDYRSYSNLADLFNTNIIKAGNFYKYDTSLSISKNWYSYVNWGNVQQRSYDPLLAETCYVYRPDRIIYSLQQQYESVKDNWRLFLANNYRDFLSRVNSVKQINKSGVLVLFQADSPLAFQGLDQLQTDLGTKLTIGDGGLFSQPQQAVMNAERAFEYASCQNRLSAINTPGGLFWINQNQGKIFQWSSGIKEISMGGVKWWLAQYLPYQLTKFFPRYKKKDNPVSGIGCQTIYDNQNNLVYFCKKDYKPVLGSNGNPLVVYNEDEDRFYIPNFNIPVSLTDTRYFESASWTLSYDMKTEEWVSYHDWHPDITIASKNTFLTTKADGIWVHNQRCDYYTQYYGTDYPFEIEYMVNTVQTVNTLRSIEYQLEVYKYMFDNCYDRFHVLDFNFDAAVVYNTEQCSGTLKLNLTPKNNPPLLLQYPFYNTGTNVNEILFSKEENKYRFNQFYDITDNRGEFPLGSNYPVTAVPPAGSTVLSGSYPSRRIWTTGADGYRRTLNTANLNYNKNQLEHKKFRHYTTSVLLKRMVSGDKKMLLTMANNKNLLSPR